MTKIKKITISKVIKDESIKKSIENDKNKIIMFMEHI